MLLCLKIVNINDGLKSIQKTAVAFPSPLTAFTIKRKPRKQPFQTKPAIIDGLTRRGQQKCFSFCLQFLHFYAPLSQDDRVRVTDVGGSKHAVDVTGTFSLLSWIREAQKRLLTGLRICKFITNSVVKKNVHVQSCSQLLSA